MTIQTSIVPRYLYGLVIASLTLLLFFPAIQHSTWNKNRLYHRLITGDNQQQIMAASTLAYLGGQEQLLLALHSDNSSVRSVGRRALEYLWFNVAGAKAYHLLETAYQVAETNNYPEALRMLDQLLAAYPDFSEAWNRRASIWWEMGEIDKCIADSQKTLALNPNHYGAWQGLAVCHMHKGNMAEACRCFRNALKIVPHDVATRDALKRCESLLRSYPGPGKWHKSLDLVRLGSNTLLP